ncbi:hypothetical protein [Solimonas soli]|uniref:hypothetical protein n=1 Tax=Solimonas soli TaxID=413479 RepID=UPI0004821834|nr:hypothetical protein [Solimonas soli]
MGCCNEPAAALGSTAPLPNKHVNFAKGMVLGVDDLRQEFAYHAGRGRWLAREAIGYGRLSGLAITVDDTPDGPRLRVAPGSALAPSGQLICVPSEQCALLNRWLAKADNATQIDALAGSPPPPSVSLYLTLCYADCLTDAVPIPGEPCRSEDELMAPSRVADDYRLELRSAAPAQREEDAIRDFVRWLRAISVVDASPPAVLDEAALLAALRDAAQPWIDALNASPPLGSPSSPPPPLSDYLFGSPALSVTPAQLPELLGIAMRFWVTSLRPLWQTCCCACTPSASDDCVLLARVEVPVVFSGGVWLVDSAGEVSIDGGAAPLLVSQRLLQEWLLAGVAAPAPAPLPPPGGATIAVTAVNSNLALDATQHCLLCSGAPTLTLPAAAQHAGRVYIVRSLGAATALQPSGTDSIDGGPTLSVPAGNALTLVSDGVAIWRVIGRG